MAPPKGPRATAQQEATFEDTPPISKQKLAAQSQFAARGRRNGNNVATMNGNGLKELAAASAVAQMNPQPVLPTIGVWPHSLVKSISKFALTLESKYRLTGKKKTPNYCIDTAQPTTSLLPRHSKTPWRFVYYNRASVPHHLQWHVQRTREEYEERS
jgi:hypothetical protein